MTRARPYSDPCLPAGRLGYVVQLYDGSFGSLFHPGYQVEKKAAP